MNLGNKAQPRQLPMQGLRENTNPEHRNMSVRPETLLGWFNRRRNNLVFRCIMRPCSRGPMLRKTCGSVSYQPPCGSKGSDASEQLRWLGPRPWSQVFFPTQHCVSDPWDPDFGISGWSPHSFLKWARPPAWLVIATWPLATVVSIKKISCSQSDPALGAPQTLPSSLRFEQRTYVHLLTPIASLGFVVY